MAVIQYPWLRSVVYVQEQMGQFAEQGPGGSWHGEGEPYNGYNICGHCGLNWLEPHAQKAMSSVATPL